MFTSYIVESGVLSAIRLGDHICIVGEWLSVSDRGSERSPSDSPQTCSVDWKARDSSDSEASSYPGVMSNVVKTSITTPISNDRHDGSRIQVDLSRTLEPPYIDSQHSCTAYQSSIWTASKFHDWNGQNFLHVDNQHGGQNEVDYQHALEASTGFVSSKSSIFHVESQDKIQHAGKYQSSMECLGRQWSDEAGFFDKQSQFGIQNEENHHSDPEIRSGHYFDKENLPRVGSQQQIQNEGRYQSDLDVSSLTNSLEEQKLPHEEIHMHEIQHEGNNPHLSENSRIHDLCQLKFLSRNSRRIIRSNGIESLEQIIDEYLKASGNGMWLLTQMFKIDNNVAGKLAEEIEKWQRSRAKLINDHVSDSNK